MGLAVTDAPQRGALLTHAKGATNAKESLPPRGSSIGLPPPGYVRAFAVFAAFVRIGYGPFITGNDFGVRLGSVGFGFRDDLEKQRTPISQKNGVKKIETTVPKGREVEANEPSIYRGGRNGIWLWFLAVFGGVGM